MIYAVLFAAGGAICLWRAIAEGGWYYALAWPGLSFLLLAAAYAGVGPRILGKRPDGTMAWWAVLALLPYLLFTWSLWYVRCLASRSDGRQEIIPGLWLGRRPTSRETPEVSLVVDLTAEFPANRRLRRQAWYVCVPTLDAATTDDRDLLDVVARIAETPDPVLVHCALGHGRSATVVAAVLMAKGLATTPQAAEDMIRKIRPSVKLNGCQRQQLARIQGQLDTKGPEHP